MGIASAEKGARPPENWRVITPEQVIEANRDPISQARIGMWKAARDAGELGVTFTCADARTGATYMSGDPRNATVHTVAAAGPMEGYKDLISHRAFRQVAVVGHYDGEQFKVDGFPLSCGGLVAKSKSSDGSKSGIASLDQYVNDGIHHSDVLEQTFYTARQAAKFARAPVLAAALNHLTGLLDPFAVMIDGGNTIILANNFDIDAVHDQRYNGKVIPSFTDDEVERLPPGIRMLIYQNRIRAKIIHDTDPDFSRRMKVQNPYLLIASTAINPSTNRLNPIVNGPNQAFVVRLPRVKDVFGKAFIPDHALLNSVGQAAYAFAEANHHRGTDKAFSALKTMLIETPHLQQSVEVGRVFMRQEVVEKWVHNGGRIIVSEVRRSKTIDAKFF